VGFEIDVLRADGPPDGYQVEAVYRDVATGEVLAAPTLVFLEDQEARTESRIGETGQTAELSVRVGERGESVSYEMVLRGDGRVIGKHRATVEVGG
jgi:hypothetical protein